MANPEHLQIIAQGIEVWNNWRKKIDNIRPDLKGGDFSDCDFSHGNFAETDFRNANLSDAYLPNADLFAANLYKANLTNAYLEAANLTGANLDNAILNNAILSFANLSDAHLNEANFNEAVLDMANLSNAELNETNFHGSTFGWTILVRLDLSLALGLETTQHLGPSSLGVDTIYKSNGKISELFLRNVGIPEGLIEYLPSFREEAIQFYSCFISYSTSDQEFAQRLHADLQSKGVRCWFAPEDIKGGRKLYEQIPEAIRLYDKLLLVLSDSSMESEWVRTEIYHARQQEARERRRKLFPISIVPFKAISKWQAFDADIGKDMAREVREYFIPDFSRWKDHDAYTKALNRLLRDLAAGGEN
jgi:hypothetical protein